MADVGTIRTALGVRLATISNLTIYDRWPNQSPVNTPCAIVLPTDGEYEQNFGDGRTAKLNFEVYLFASLAPGYEQAQRTLDPLLATSSTGGVYGAIHADRKLVSTVHDTFIRGHRNYDQIGGEDGGPAYAAAVVDVTVWSS